MRGKCGEKSVFLVYFGIIILLMFSKKLQYVCFKIKKAYNLYRDWSTSRSDFQGTCTSERKNQSLQIFIIPVAKLVDNDSTDFAVLENTKVVSGRKKMETAAENVGRQFFKKQLNIGSKQGRTNPANFIKQPKRELRHNFENISG